ncbi:hypothetical protein ACP4OV_001214 [Aristida adscensionis]
MAGREETALDMAKFIDKGVQVELTGGRQGIYDSGIFVLRFHQTYDGEEVEKFANVDLLPLRQTSIPASEVSKQQAFR